MALEEVLLLRQEIQTFVRFFGLLDANKTPCGKPLSIPHAHALMILNNFKDHGHEPQQKDLGRQLGLDKSNVARLCQKMEKEGHLVQEVDHSDGRALKLKLTAKGQKLALSVHDSSLNKFSQILGKIPSSKRKKVIQSFAIINQAIQDLGGSRV